MSCLSLSSSFFFFNDTATTEIYTLSLHDALPISTTLGWLGWGSGANAKSRRFRGEPLTSPSAPNKRSLLGSAAFACLLSTDRKSTRLNSSHDQISYAVFCLKKKKKTRVVTSGTAH